MKKVFLFFAAILMAVVASAQVDEVTLTVIGTGINEEKATLQALRSAIEQSFGTFVSANTTILNDKLVQDEIVSVSNGNVKDYQKLAVIALPNGQISVSVRATVSINKLISYAKSKGSRAEFAGQTFAANVKLMKLKAESATKTYELMVQQLERLAKDMYDFELVLSPTPILRGDKYEFDANVLVYVNAAFSDFCKVLSTRSYLILPESEMHAYRNAGIECSAANIEDCDSYPGDYNPIWIPIKKTDIDEFNKRIYEAIRVAPFRYQIHEIGNAKNSYEWQHSSNDWLIFKSVLYGMNASTIKYHLKFLPSIGSHPQKKLYEYKICLMVPANNIGNSRGFEIVGASSPTNKAR